MGEDYNQLIGAGREKDIKSGLGLTERWQKHSLIVVRRLSLSREGGGIKRKPFFSHSCSLDMHFQLCVIFNQVRKVIIVLQSNKSTLTLWARITMFKV